MDIDIIFDASCPWCYIGTQRFRNALGRYGLQRVNLNWRPFILNPEFPDEGLPWNDFLKRKFGDPRRIKRVMEAVEQAARASSVEIRLDRITRAPNTLAAHRLIRLGSSANARGCLVDAVFRAFFVEGADIGDLAVLEEIGVRQGLDRLATREHLAEGRDASEVLAESAVHHSLGMNGVPGFVFNHAHAIAGAQDEDVFSRMIEVALELSTPEPVSNR